MFDERMASSMITHRFAAKALGAASMSARSLEASAAGKCLVQSAQACVPLWLVLLCITLHLLSGTANADAEAATAGAKQQDTHTVLTSEAESLAQPKWLQQTGIPADATRAAIPSDNPQTPGKLPSAKDCSSSVACRLMGLSLAVTAMTPNKPSPTVAPSRSVLKATSANGTRQLS